MLGNYGDKLSVGTQIKVISKEETICNRSNTFTTWSVWRSHTSIQRHETWHNQNTHQLVTEWINDPRNLRWKIRQLLGRGREKAASSCELKQSFWWVCKWEKAWVVRVVWVICPTAEYNPDHLYRVLGRLQHWNQDEALGCSCCRGSRDQDSLEHRDLFYVISSPCMQLLANENN